MNETTTATDLRAVHDAWAALTAPTPPPTSVMQHAITALEAAGFQVHLIGTTVYADLAEPVDRDGQTHLYGSLRIDQEA